MADQPSAELLLDAFLSNSAEAIVGFGLDGAIFLWNKTAEALYGFSRPEIIGKSVSCLLPLYELPAHEILLKDPSCPAPLSDALLPNALTAAACAFRSGSSGRLSATATVKLSALWSARKHSPRAVHVPSRKRTCAFWWNRENCRATDIAARYGGDEFAILLLDADGERAQNVAHRVAACLRSQTDPPPLSVSIGYSVYLRDGLSAPELLEAADKRLYRNKKSRHTSKPDNQQTEPVRTSPASP